MIRALADAVLVVLARVGSWALNLPAADDDWQGITDERKATP